MISELIAEGGGQRLHRHRLRQLLTATKGPVRVASAYVTDYELLSGVEDREVQLLTSLARDDVISGATSLKSLRLLTDAGVHCRCFSDGPRFHAKVYLFGDEDAVVTSANLTNRAFNSNIEVGVHLTGTAAQDLCTWFDAFWLKANPIDSTAIAQWEQQTEGLRREYASLRKKAQAIPKLPHEATPSVSSRAQLDELAKNAPRSFVCNTNRRHSPDGRDEELMRQSKYAVVWEEFRHTKHMDRVRPGDAIYMFAKGTGIVGVGRAQARREILPPNDPERIARDNGYATEWRVPVDGWLAWVENDADAYGWKMPNASFLDITGDRYGELREKVFKHFLGNS